MPRIRQVGAAGQELQLIELETEAVGGDLCRYSPGTASATSARIAITRPPADAISATAASASAVRVA
jgi:hypothetical protein